jgi:hypothetical protein
MRHVKLLKEYRVSCSPKYCVIHVNLRVKADPQCSVAGRPARNFYPAEPELLRAVFELIENDLPVVEGLLVDDPRGCHGRILSGVQGVIHPNMIVIWLSLEFDREVYFSTY